MCCGRNRFVYSTGTSGLQGLEQRNMFVASVFAGRFVDAAHRQGMDTGTAIAGPRVGLLRLLTNAAAVVRSPAAGHATLRSAADG